MKSVKSSFYTCGERCCATRSFSWLACVCVIMQWPCATDTGLLPGKKSAQNYIEELWERKSPARQAIYFNFSSIYSAKLHFYRVKYCIVTWSFWLFTSVLQTVIPTSIVILKVFRELNKLQFNFVATSLRQFWTELFAKKTFGPFDL